MKNNNFSRLTSLLIYFSSFISLRYGSFFILLISLFLTVVLSSCEKEPEPIGVEDKQLISTFFTDTVTISVKIFQSDSINTTSRTGNSRLLIGSLSDEYVGSYSAQAFGTVSLTTLTEDFRNNAGEIAIYDSLVGFFQTDYVYGDTTLQSRIQLYEISEPFRARDYYQFDTLRTLSSVVGSAIYPFALDSNRVLRVRFEEQYGRRLFNYGVDNKFENDSLFRVFSKGLAFRSASPNTSIIGINPLAPATNLTLYFHYPNDSVSSSYKFDMPISFSNIESDLSNSALSALVTQDFISTENTNDIAVIQAGTGISVKLEFPYLKSFIENKSVVIQRAELDIPVLETATSSRFAAPNQLLFLYANGDGYSYSLDGTLQFLPSESSNNTSLSMGYSIAGKSYSYASMTSYINQLAKGRIIGSDGLIIQPSENNISVNRLIFPTQKNANNLPAIRLRMYYSIAE